MQEGDGETAVRVPQRRLERDRVAEAPQRLVEPAASGEGEPEIELPVRVCRAGRRGALRLDQRRGRFLRERAALLELPTTAAGAEGLPGGMARGHFGRASATHAVCPTPGVVPAPVEAEPTGTSASPRFAVGAREHDDVPIRIADPHLPMVRRRVDVGLLDHRRAERARSRDGRVEVVDLEPHEDAVADGRGVGVHEVRVVLLVPGVELENQLPARVEPLVDVTVVAIRIRLEPEELGVPALAGPDVADGQDRLRSDPNGLCSHALVLSERVAYGGMNPKVDAFLKRQTTWKREFVKLRQIILGCGLTEELKWGHPCYTDDEDRNIVLMHGFKAYCAVLFPKGALLKDAKRVLIQQTPNVQVARQIRFTSIEDVVRLEKTLKAYVREAIDVERAGLKVELKKTSDFPMPEELQLRLETDRALKKAFDALTPGRQRAYIFYFSQAKQPKTRASRVEKCIPRIREGLGLDD